MPRTRNIIGWPIMKQMCASCPFNKGGDKRLANNVLDRTLFKSSQICHHPMLHGKKETHLCRGQRNEQLILLHRMGLITAPTDEAFTIKSKELEDAKINTVR